MAAPEMRYTRLNGSEDDEMNGRNLARAHSKSLYTSHFVSTWNSRGFEFGSILFLATIYPGTLLPMSIYALVRALAAIIFAPIVGRYIDSGNRLTVIRLSIVGQRLAVAASCLAFLYLLLYRNNMSKLLNYAIFVVLVIFACVEKLSIMLNTISVERDWVVVLADKDERLLQSMNSQMRRIDLFCKLVSPLAVALLDGFSSSMAIIVTFGLNSTSVVLEYFLIAWVYRSNPNLANKTLTNQNSSHTFEDNEGTSADSAINRAAISLMHQAKAYINSNAFLPSLALAMLYLTVLSFSGQMITYLFDIDNPRLTSVHIGIMRTVSTLLEMSSTFIAPVLIERLGAVRTGIWSLSWQSFCLTVGLSTFWIESRASAALSTYILVASIILSRIGLWCFDLTAQLLVQNSIDASQRGSFSATESSLQNFFELCTFTMTIVWSRPDQFRWPATVSLGAVFAASICYARFVRVERGHLLHMPRCCEFRSTYKAISAAEEDEGIELGR